MSGERGTGDFADSLCEDGCSVDGGGGIANKMPGRENPLKGPDPDSNLMIYWMLSSSSTTNPNLTLAIMPTLLSLHAKPICAGVGPLTGHKPYHNPNFALV